MTQTVQPELLAVSPANPNLIINGDMRIAQRGTSFAGYTTANSGAVTLDRFKYYSTGAETVTISQDTDVPSGQGFTTSLKVDVTTADATVGAGDIVRIETPLEGNDVAHLMFGTANAKQATLSFWVKSPKTGAHYVNFSESSSYARCYPALYTVSVADTWEYKTITLTGDTTGTWGTGLGVGLTAGFVLMAGSSFLGTADTWQAASVFAASGVVNCMDNIANNFFLTGVKLEVGSTATAFVPDDYSTAMAKCQRYFCKTYIYAHAPGTATSASAIFSNADSTSAAGPSYGLMGYFSYPVYMRTSPTLTTYGITTGSLWYNMTTGGSLAVGTLGNGNRACTLVCTAAPSTGVSYSIQATADAEL